MIDEKYSFLFEDDDPEVKRIKNMLDDMGVNLDELDSEMQNYNPKKPLGYEVISDDAVEPNYNYPTDSGFDLYSTIDILIPALGRGLIPTGLKFDIPDGTEIQVRPKSGLAINQGLTVLNTPGTADCGYTGEIKVIVFNTNQTEFKIEKGMKVAQAVLCPVINGKWVELIKLESIEEKDRGENGFGSTGIFKN
jgi:dUTP pyrophosphatase